MTVLAETPLNVTGTRKIAFERLVRVELRKLADTRAGRWLLISVAALTALVLVIQLWVVVAQDLQVDFSDFLLAMNTPMGILLPVLGVMSVTSEWSQRTAMVTFALEPSRLRVVAAKLVSVLVVSVGALAVGLLLGALAQLLYGVLSGNELVWGSAGTLAFNYLVSWVLGMVTGFAYGALLLNSAAGIVVYFVYSFVLPIPFAIGAQLMDWFDHLRPWIDFSFAQGPLLQGSLTGSEWAHLATSGLIWLVLPLVVGIWRINRAEVK
ncbi:MAG: ABC transporter permease subunit [Nocardioides sp.]|nr:ABC transporter permease subunit [Nocardioides sp.]